MTEEIDWKEKYESMKKSLEMLKECRYSSVKDDIKEVKFRINQHKSIHEIAKKQVIAVNEELKNATKEYNELEEKKRKLEEYILSIQDSLAEDDPIFNNLSKYPKISLSGGLSRNYIFTCGPNSEMKFSIITKGNKVIFSPLDVPNGWRILPWMYKETEFSYSEVSNMFKAISNATPNY